MSKSSLKSIPGKHRKSLTPVEIQEKINLLRHSYMPMDLNPSFHYHKLTAIKKIDFILKHASRRNIQNCEFEELLLCALMLIYYFGMQIKQKNIKSSGWFSRCCNKRQFHNAELVFQKTMDILQPERSESAIKITLNFFSTVGIWHFESFVGQILEVVLYFDKGHTTLYNLMLTDIHYVIFKDVISARHRMRVFYDLLNSDNWVIEKQKLLPFVTRLLDFFTCSITKHDSKISAYKYLRKGFEVCLRRIFERAQNYHRLRIITTMLNWFAMVKMSDDDVLEFSSLLDRVAELYVVERYSDSFKEGFFNHVLVTLVASSNSLYSLVGCRLLERFLDRQCNAPYLMTPTIYYEFSQVKLKKGNYNVSDKVFIRKHRDKFHEYFLITVKTHNNNIVNLKCLFSVISSIILEVPCSLTAAMAACLMMVIQDFAINAENLSVTSRYWMHALVISVMSLICWVHKAPVLYSYVNQIISRRAKEAPQLNPPLMKAYKVSHHHITWNKPTLFFEDWELRYGLWKHFQDNRPTATIDTSIKKKAPIMDLGY